MCTVSFLPSADGFLLAMNRDELRTRPTALPPEYSQTGELRSLYPRDPGGGTWVGVNEAGLVFALLDWHARPSHGPGATASRSKLIPALLAAGSPQTAREVRCRLDLAALGPFRLVVAAAGGRRLEEWRSDGEGGCEVAPLPWRRAHWFSSSFDEARANRTRTETCEREAWVSPARTLAWLHDLHRSHHPAKGAFSVCMHRANAATANCTELAVNASAATMTYSTGPACEPGPRLCLTLPLRLPPTVAAPAAVRTLTIRRWRGRP